MARRFLASMAALLLAPLLAHAPATAASARAAAADRAAANDAASRAVRFCDLSELTPHNVRGLMALASVEPLLQQVRLDTSASRAPVAAGDDIAGLSAERLAVRDYATPGDIHRQGGALEEIGAALGYRVDDRRGGGRLTAWDPDTLRVAWVVSETTPITSGALVTAGGLLFYGTADGWLKALDARSGKLLWRRHLEHGARAAPVSYLGPDGHQYLSLGARTFSLPR